MRYRVAQRWLLLGLLLLSACFVFGSPSALAADVIVVAEPGVSDILANEYRDITAKVMEFYQTIYNFVPNKTIKVIVVPDELGYVQVLQREGHTQEQAIRTAKASAGVSLGSKPIIVICADKNLKYLPRIKTVAHEMFHQLQWNLKGNAQEHYWLTEGSAKMSEYVLLEWLGEGSLAAHRQSLVNFLVNTKIKAGPYDLLNGGAQWTSLMEQKMYPYQVSELMTDYMMAQAGKPAIARYFAYLGETHNRDAAFQKAFGMSHDQFVQKYYAYMKQEEAAIGQLKFEVEGDVAPEMVQRINSNGKSIEQMLRGQGWKLSMSSRFILVPNQDAMLKVMHRELPQVPANKLDEIVRRGTIASVGEMNFVFDVGKTAEPDRGFSKLALIVCRSSIVMTARPAPVMSIYWLYEGTARILAAKAEEAAGWKKAGDSRQEWIAAIQKAQGYPTLAQMTSFPTSAVSRYGEEAVYATAALATGYLTEKLSPDILLRYFTVFRDLNDGPRAFQQVSGMTLEAFEIEFGTYLTGLTK